MKSYVGYILTVIIDQKIVEDHMQSHYVHAH